MSASKVSRSCPGRRESSPSKNSENLISNLLALAFARDFSEAALQPPCCAPSGGLSYGELGQDALFSVIVRANIPTLEQFSSRYNFDTVSSGPTAHQLLFTALHYQQYNILAALLDHPQLDIRATGDQGQTVLHVAVMKNDYHAVEIFPRNFSILIFIASILWATVL